MGEEAIQLLFQGGALGLLGYLILWTTREGAPKLFERLAAIQVAITANTNKMANLEEKVDNAHTEISNLREDITDLRIELTKKGP